MHYTISVQYMLIWVEMIYTRTNKFLTDDLNEGSSNFITGKGRCKNSRCNRRFVCVDTKRTITGQALVWDGGKFEPGTVGSTLTIQDEGTALSTAGTTLNFVGTGVTASGTGATKTITIPGSCGIIQKRECCRYWATTLNLLAGSYCNRSGATKTITITGACR